MLKRFIAYYKPHKVLFIFDMLASLLISLIGLVYPILTRKVFREYVYDSDGVSKIIIIVAILLVLYFIRLLLKYFVQYKGHVMGTLMQAQMRRDLFIHLQDLPFSYYDENETGKIMTRMTNDLQNVSELAHHGPENIFIAGFTVIGSFIYLFSINWLLALIILACVPILVTISLIFRRRMRLAYTENRKNLAEINAALSSSISGIRVTKAFTNKEKELEKFEVGNKKYVESRSMAYKAMGQFGSSTGFVMDIFNVACIAGGAILVLYDKLVLADYLAFIVSINLFINPLTTLINFVEQYQDGVTGFRRFIEIMDEKAEIEKEGAIDDVSLEGNINFDHVSFSYETGGEILKDISFKIPKGEVVAFVGPSGGGKTTICHLIPGFYKVSKGAITIDGYNINDLTFKALRGNIGIVQQDVFLFNGTIKENILYGRLDASDEEVIKAAKDAKIYDFVQTLPNGFDTEIGERGIKLSGGQRQRLSIARLFLKDPSILILDEATSALDNTTEVYIQEALDNLAKGRTTIVVAHRLSTIRRAQMIYVINNGQVTEKGNHKELLEKNGTYAKLYHLTNNLDDWEEE